MARPIILIFGKKEYPVELGRKVTKDDLYGKVKRVVEKDGQPLERGLLSHDGYLLARKSLSSVRLDPEGLGGTEEVLHDGESVETLPFPFDEAAPRGVAAHALAGFCVSDVYPLKTARLNPAHSTGLLTGRVRNARRRLFGPGRRSSSLPGTVHFPLVGLGLRFLMRTKIPPPRTRTTTTSP